MGAQVIGFKKRQNEKFLENLASGQQITLNIGGETRVGFYKQGPIALKPEIIGGMRRIVGANRYRFAIKDGNEIWLAEVWPWDEDLNVVNGEIHLPPKYSSLHMWTRLDPNGYYHQNISKKFAIVGL